jgi:DNA-directed RNA polymerase sigma subunit (sigma70/sigma32)
MLGGGCAFKIRRVLEPASERRLVLAAQAGDDAAWSELLDALRPSIGAMALHYADEGSERHLALVHEGGKGLLRALDRYGPDSATPFWAYASWWVRQAIQSAVA